MTVVNGLRKLVDRKIWEMLAPLPSTNNPAFAVFGASTQSDGLMMYVNNSNAYLYNALEDAWMQFTTPGIVTWTNPAIAYHPSGPTGTASAGGTKTITTTLTLPQSLRGYTIRITGGTGAGQEQVITGNTFGANAVITVTSAWTTQPDNTSTYLILSGRFWVINGSSVLLLKYFDVATSAWASGSTTSLSSVTAAGIALTPTPAWGGTASSTIASGTATSGSGTTLTNSGKAWTASQWINYQVRITGGTGAGQVRTITANTSTALTVATWTTNPDSTSTYVIEPNDDFLYLVGGNALTLQRYSISGASWSTLSPGTARVTNANLGCSLTFVAVASDPYWADETNIHNGRYLYSFPGNSSQNLSIYDIAGNNWNNLSTSYGRTSPGFLPTTGWTWCSTQEYTYWIQNLTTAYATFYRFDAARQCLDPWSQFPYAANTTAGGGSWAAIGAYTDTDGTVLRYVYVLPWSSTSPSALYRTLII